MGHRQIKQAVLGTLLAEMGKLFGGRRPKITARDLDQAEFKTSTQAVGMRFTERVRRNFRFRWLRRQRNP